MISVIVPVYNAEAYLHHCVNSILIQSYTDFELLLVDDGSPDRCGAICDEYAAKDCRIRVFHKENGGVSSARNLGLEQAQGEWVTFVDSDDWLAEECFESLMSADDADLVVGSCMRSSGTKLQVVDNWYDKTTVPDFLNDYLDKLLLRTPWGKLFKRSIIVENNIHFDEKLRFGEDTLFVFQYLCYCDSIAAVSYCGYNYLDETDGWVRNSRKYKLSLSEIDVSLGKTLALIERLSERFDSSFDTAPHIFVFLSMYSTVNFSSDDVVVTYKNICHKYIPNLGDNAFWSSRLYSPILRGIMELKHYYQDKLYIKGKVLYPILYSISQVAPNKIPFVYKDFYLWYWLIRHKAFVFCDILLYMYLAVKKLISLDR